MTSRSNISLKTIAILVFTFELLATSISAFSSYSINYAVQLSESGLAYSATGPSHLFSHYLIFEELNAEEDTKERKWEFHFVEIFHHLKKFECPKISWILTEEIFDIRPPLFTLYGVLQI